MNAAWADYTGAVEWHAPCSAAIDVDLFGIRFIGANHETALKLGITLAVIGALVIIRLVIVGIARMAAGRADSRALFWVRQGTSLAALAVVLVASVSIWFDDPSRFTTVLGLATAGIAIAAQKAVTSFAGYLVIMRGNTFTVGDRIKMGGVGGDVIALGFLQTRIMEMGQPSEVNEQEAPGMWVRARQFSGRIVTITNDKIFDEPVYNYTREFPFIWEEIHVPIAYRTDRQRAEQIMLDAVRAASEEFGQRAAEARRRLERRYGIEHESLEPRVYWQITDNWLAMAVRFVVPEHGIRPLKDRITRTILAEFDRAGVEIGTSTSEVTIYERRQG
jgi:small-conductance mechanosensitive channel